MCCSRSTCALILEVTFGIGVPYGNRQNAAEKVQVFAPFQVPDVLHPRAIGHQRVLVQISNCGPYVFPMFANHLFALARVDLRFRFRFHDRRLRPVQKILGQTVPDDAQQCQTKEDCGIECTPRLQAGQYGVGHSCAVGGRPA